MEKVLRLKRHQSCNKNVAKNWNEKLIFACLSVCPFVHLQLFENVQTLSTPSFLLGFRRQRCLWTCLIIAEVLKPFRSTLKNILKFLAYQWFSYFECGMSVRLSVRPSSFKVNYNLRKSTCPPICPCPNTIYFFVSWLFFWIKIMYGLFEKCRRF